MSSSLAINEIYTLFASYATNRKYKDAMKLIDEAIDSKIDPHLIFTEIIGKTLNNIQTFAEEGYKTISSFQVLAISKITEGAIKKLKNLMGDQKQHIGTIILGNIQRDYHVLGPEILRVFLEAAGWNVIYLGPDTPPKDFIRAAKENEADIIMISSMMMNTAGGIPQVRALLDREKLSGKIILMVGGAPFNFNLNLVKKVKADAMAMDVYEAVEYAKQLKDFGKIVDYKTEKKKKNYAKSFRLFKMGGS